LSYSVHTLHYTTALSTLISSLSFNHHVGDDTWLLMFLQTSLVPRTLATLHYKKLLTGCLPISSLSTLPKLNSFFLAFRGNSINLTILFLISHLKPLFTHLLLLVIWLSSLTITLSSLTKFPPSYLASTTSLFFVI
jgi:hypothetical protein